MQDVKSARLQWKPDAGEGGPEAGGSRQTAGLQKPLRLRGSRRVREGRQGAIAGDGERVQGKMELRLRQKRAARAWRLRVAGGGRERAAGVLHQTASRKTGYLDRDSGS